MDASAAPLRWLHLDGLVIADQENRRQQEVLDALISAFAGDGLLAERRPDLVFCSGDVAASGKATEYSVAQRFFSGRVGDTVLPASAGMGCHREKGARFAEVAEVCHIGTPPMRATHCSYSAGLRTGHRRRPAARPGGRGLRKWRVAEVAIYRGLPPFLFQLRTDQACLAQR